MIKKNLKLELVVIWLIFFLQTMSFLMTLNLNFLKYISIFILNGLVILKCIKNGINEKDLVIFLILFIILLLSCAFQNTLISGKISSIVFYITFLTWSLLSYKIINKREQILYVVYGISIAVIIGLVITFNEVLSQLASIYNSRTR